MLALTVEHYAIFTACLQSSVDHIQFCNLFEWFVSLAFYHPQNIKLSVVQESSKHTSRHNHICSLFMQYYMPMAYIRWLMWGCQVCHMLDDISGVTCRLYVTPKKIQKGIKATTDAFMLCQCMLLQVKSNLSYRILKMVHRNCKLCWCLSEFIKESVLSESFFAFCWTAERRQMKGIQGGERHATNHPLTGDVVVHTQHTNLRHPEHHSL